MAALNYHHLRYFHAVAREGSLTRAAQQLNVSPSALSVQIGALEAQLGQKLFDRRGRGLLLTEAGRIALAHAETVFRSGEELLSTLKGLAPGQRQVLRVGAVATLSRNFQLGLLRPLLGQPEVGLEITSGGFEELLARLEAHALDLVLANQPATIGAESEWQNTLVADQPVSLVGRQRATPLRFPADLATEALVLPGRGSALRAGFDRLMDEAGITPRVLAEVDDMAMLRLLARESGAVTLVPPVVVVDELEAGVLVEHCRLPQLHEAFYAITRRRRFPNPLLRLVVGG
ncbi:LysR family transcriptional regulator [Roseomonas stagni]|uniref:LysR family transcriptional regulator n=1 Tax=Falsiroseomonas algicola TaxID=2716930 RepID=A0A6M1LEQ2_9PROT|nr:LysR family transcriptional regulator [Falsiroseomonas algicola]NGM18464.1 LysR family transcriptional regulator [Falsiroseomonas algicola]